MIAVVIVSSFLDDFTDTARALAHARFHVWRQTGFIPELLRQPKSLHEVVAVPEQPLVVHGLSNHLDLGKGERRHDILVPLWIDGHPSSASIDSFRTGPDGLHTEQLLVHRKMLHLKTLSQ